MKPERRQKRSNFHAQALEYWLGSVVEDLDADIVLADESGLLVASTADDATAETVAAVAPARYEGEIPFEMDVDCLDIDGQALYLCAVGDDAARRTGMDAARDGIQRIFQPLS